MICMYVCMYVLKNILIKLYAIVLLVYNSIKYDENKWSYLFSRFAIFILFC